MELLDIYDKYKHKTGRTYERGTLINKGDYRLVVHIWIVNDKNEILIQKRQPWKNKWPNMWDASAAGCATQGDTSIMAIIRETKEEIGIDLDINNVEFLFSVRFYSGFDDIWLLKKNIHINDLILQDEEVADAKWVSQEKIMEMVKAGKFVEYHYLEELFKIIKSDVKLKKATPDEVDDLLAIQKKVFMPLYKKYEDHETTPVNQTLEEFMKRFDIGDYYKIFFKDNLVGGVFVYEKNPGVMRLHIINIIEEYQNKGIAQEVMIRLELMYPQAESWELDTILSENRNCYLYEKMGYVKYEEPKIINDRMSLVSYRKFDSINRIRGI
ncbi:bifunctional NUDIX hydrolase family protein/GNAT family N-acetyltransferase [Clostridium grantii]|uniref:Isopentenyldiphosphate isomerase n=1 Tax=Clostridium grantii DSM 8605 TaxID=1121316 RepID=A0A1M5VMU1_9CLOT|nr:bifunctional NUDIX hydrolase family protein/GNAT family N-acetyltransferase [Clostridium grantii]SHH76520.1 Isopentenyldiphosphate isomerase [Clostridium grantii DSM 8605]